MYCADLTILIRSIQCITELTYVKSDKISGTEFGKI